VSSVSWWLVAAGDLRAEDHVTFRVGENQRRLTGQVQITAEDGGLLLLARDGSLWTIEPAQLVAHTKDAAPFQPFSKDELATRLLAELPAGFETQQTAHYLICHNTSRAYAQWCGSLFERLYKAFENFWTRKGFKLRDPEFPLVAIIFDHPEPYVQHIQGELPGADASVMGYYSLKSNRVTMYDLTGVASQRSDQRRLSSAQINAMLSRPEAEKNVATVIHEATHQIAFNCGLQTRLADIPVWVSEGIAMYFESPDLKSDKGWRTIGGVNQLRVGAFREYLRRRPVNSLPSLALTDQRLRNPQSRGDAYAESWALTYFLMRHKPEQFTKYLQVLAAKQPLQFDTPEERAADLKQTLGDLRELDEQFVRVMQKVR
jgi:hypothetical protein